MSFKFEINNSDSYEYLIHGQNLQIQFYIPYSLFILVRFKETHTKLWFHKFLTGTYYIAPFIYFYNFLILNKFPGFKNNKILNTNFDYPGTSYKFNKIRNSIWDNRILIKKNKSVIHTTANYLQPNFTFISFGFGIKLKKLYLKINNVDVIDNKIESPKIIMKTNIVTVNNQNLMSIIPLKIKSNYTEIQNFKIEIGIEQPICSINSKELLKQN